MPFVVRNLLSSSDPSDGRIVVQASIRRTGTVKHSSQRKGSVESWGELMAAEKAHDKGIELVRSSLTCLRFCVKPSIRLENVLRICRTSAASCVCADILLVQNDLSDEDPGSRSVRKM